MRYIDEPAVKELADPDPWEFHPDGRRKQNLGVQNPPDGWDPRADADQVLERRAGQDGPEREALAACQGRLSALEAEVKTLRAFVSELAEETGKSMSILDEAEPLTEPMIIRIEGRYLVWTSAMSAWGDTRELAIEKLQAQLRDGYAPGDPKALLDGGFEAESAARCGP